MTYLGIMDAPPDGFRKVKSMVRQVEDCEVWAKGSMFSKDFEWAHVRRRKEESK